MDHTLVKKQVLQRYELPSLSIKDSLTSYTEEQNQNFIATLIRAFEDDGNFNYKEFEKFPLGMVIDYVKRTHRLYFNKSLQEIEQSILLLNQAYTFGHPMLEMLNEFYLDYKTELILHIREEDQQLLPHIIYLSNSIENGFDQYDLFRRQQLFTIEHFVSTHEDNDAVLEDVREKILMYDPPVTNKFVYQVLLNQLEFFGHDLKIHGLIEDRVLLPKALEMEEKLNSLMMESAFQN
ncbi:MAG TPA: hypothetical protein PKD91_15115 [Bacteroidia bacterium]|nr:hypothetical protein [Bacteroidia bacterium]